MAYPPPAARAALIIACAGLDPPRPQAEDVFVDFFENIKIGDIIGYGRSRERSLSATPDLAGRHLQLSSSTLAAAAAAPAVPRRDQSPPRGGMGSFAASGASACCAAAAARARNQAASHTPVALARRRRACARGRAGPELVTRRLRYHVSRSRRPAAWRGKRASFFELRTCATWPCSAGPRPLTPRRGAAAGAVEVIEWR